MVRASMDRVYILVLLISFWKKKYIYIKVKFYPQNWDWKIWQNSTLWEIKKWDPTACAHTFPPVTEKISSR